MNTPINWNDIDEATSNELWAVANDIGAFVDPEAISGTVMALNAARLRDKNRGEGWDWERIYCFPPCSKSHKTISNISNVLSSHTSRTFTHYFFNRIPSFWNICC